MISLCCPSRGRPELAKRLVDTATETQKGNTEFLFYLNDDDEKLEQYKDLLDQKHYIIGPNQSTCYSWNLMCDKATNDVVMLMGDDVQIKTKHWDQIITDEINKFKDKNEQAIIKALKQVHNMEGFEPKHWNNLTSQQRSRALRYLMHLKENKHQTLKGRGYNDGRKQ